VGVRVGVAVQAAAVRRAGGVRSCEAGTP